MTLDLVDDEGMPTDALEGLRLCPEAEYKSRIAAWLRNVYAEIFAYVEPDEDGEVAVRDAFRNYSPVGQQSRMVTLFLGLCQAAGLYNTASRESKPRSRRNAVKSSGVKVASSGSAAVAGSAGSISGVAKVLPHSGKKLPPAILGLVESLPAEGESWTQSRHDQFVLTFKAVLGFCYPIKPEEMNEDNGE